ncbi:uncharacterized protein LOC116629185 isoform X3 [Phoca vitulina]|uniref:uncharacterized protein LOC116629182 isoform X3 n=1 Tax=Phoca vitulina TaxID=9720 RepID=UPI001396218F|nr:uncharacterized protein LOC116629182 isoform X3 [Phoca vitulina]XP_032255385.1 uncharacterized protein LOC116629185 isoform X3 [Phoca vitulina]
MVGRGGGFQDEKMKILPKFSSAPPLPVPAARGRRLLPWAGFPRVERAMAWSKEGARGQTCPGSSFRRHEAGPRERRWRHRRAARVHPAPRPACRALLSDRGSAALIVLGFLSLPPLLVLASAARTRLARRLLTLLPPAWTPGPRRHPGFSDRGRVGHHADGEEQLCAWV